MLHLSAPRTHTILRTSVAASIIALSSTTASVSARQDQAITTLFTLEYAGSTHALPSPKDASLNAALGHLPAVWRDMQSNIPELQQVPPAAMNLLFRLASRPGKLAITNAGFDPQTGAPGIGLALSWDMTGPDPAADARTMHNELRQLHAMNPGAPQLAESARFSGMSEFAFPFGAITFGPRQVEGAWKYQILAGRIDNPDRAFEGMPVAAGITSPVMRMKIDFAAMTPFTQMFAGFAAMMGPSGAQAVQQVRDSGFMGEDAMSFELVSGYTPDASVKKMITRGAGRFAANLNISREPLGLGDFAAIPADATFVSMRRNDPKPAWAKLRQQFQAVGQMAGSDPIGEMLVLFRDHVGVDFEADVINALGDVSAIYLSDSTGGSTFTSAVALASLTDPQCMTGALDKIAAAAGKFLAEEIDAPFAVRFASFDQGGMHYIQMRFAGLPIPFEPTIAVVDNWLVMGATPQACIAGALQARRAREGVTTSEGWSAAHWTPASHPISFTFIDTPRTMRTAYPYVSMMGSALGNLVRSVNDESREPGLIVPPYGLLKDGARPYLSQSYWSGDDYIIEMRSDTSMLVNLCGVMGVGDAAPMIAGAILGGGIATGAAEARGARRFSGGGDWDWDDWDNEEPEDSDGDAGDIDY